MHGHYQDDHHIIDASCHGLHGAPGSRIMLFRGINFENNDTATIHGPLSVTMAPGVRSLKHSALWSAGDLRITAGKGIAVQFKDIVSASRGAAAQAARNLWVEGLGTMLFENLHSGGSGGALSSDSHCVYANVAHLLFRNCSAERPGGAIFGSSCVELNSSEVDSAIRFQGCKSEWRGGAVASRGQILLTGRGTHVYEQCRSESNGGAVGTFKDIVVELQSPGSVVFSDCHASGSVWGRLAGGGGAVSSNRNIRILRGYLHFSSCSSETHRGNAMLASAGVISIGDDTQVVLEGMESTTGSALSARIVSLPPESDVLPSDVFAKKEVLASRGLYWHDRDKAACPAGSRFLLSSDGSPISGNCKMCPRGTASLGQTFLQIHHQVLVPEAGMKLILVRYSSPNTLKSIGISILNSSDGLQANTSAVDPRSLGITRGTVDDSWIIKQPPVVLSHSPKLAMTFNGSMLQSSDGGRLAVPFQNYAANQHLTMVMPGEAVNWANVSDSEMFRIDKHGIISPLHAPFVAIGVDRDVIFSYAPSDPYEACKSCLDLAGQLADKLLCPGGSHARAHSGYMLLHEPGQRTLDVHACPNKAACPGSHLRVTAAGNLSSRSRLCADGYEPTAGCVRCAEGYGRPQLDPFICKARRAKRSTPPQGCQSPGTFQKSQGPRTGLKSATSPLST